MKKILKFLLSLVILLGIVAGMVYYGTYVSINHVQIERTTVSSSKIPDELNNLEIAFISDLHYNSFMNKERFAGMIQVINDTHPDIVIFGGDLFDDVNKYPVSDADKEELISLLKTIEAPYGKFAVMGEEDHASKIKDDILNILYYGDFELLHNQSVQIYGKNGAYINLAGIDSLIGGNPDISAAMGILDTTHYTIVATHAPDLVTELSLNNIDLILSGHSHGGQISLFGLGPLKKIEGATKYSHGTHYINQSVLIISNGLGTTDYDIRLFAPPQCHIIRLSNNS